MSINICVKIDQRQLELATRSNYELVFEHDDRHIKGQPDKVIEWLGMIAGDSPYKISRLDHCLQTATRDEADDADE